MTFSDTVNNTGIVQQVRKIARVDSTQWPTVNIVNSSNNWLDFVVSYGIANDRYQQFDDTNHTKLGEGTSPLTINVTDYAFTSDEQGNPITTLLGIARLENGKYIPLKPVDRNDLNYDPSTFGQESGTPTEYDKIQDNIVRLNRIPTATVSAGLKYFFQRAGSYFSASDTTKSPGVAPYLHRGFVIAGAYDAAFTLGLKNLSALAGERQFEIEKMKEYFSARNNDVPRRMLIGNHSCR